MKFLWLREDISHDSFQGTPMNGPLFTDINDYKSQPCLNNSTCKVQVNSFNCHCDEGYTGLECKTVQQKSTHTIFQNQEKYDWFL